MIYLLTLTVGPQTYRLATSTTHLEVDGRPVQYLAGLIEVDWALGTEIGADSELTDVPIFLTSGALDVPAILRAGHDLAAGVAELARIRPGQTWAQRQRLLSGRVSEPTHGSASEPVAFSLRLLGENTRVLVPAGYAVLDGPTVTAGSRDAVVPIVFGEPSAGYLATSKAGAGSPAYYGGTLASPPLLGEVIVCSHGPVTATTVDLTYSDPLADRVTWVEHDIVTNGELVTVQLQAGLHINSLQNTKFLARWNGGSGIRQRDSQQPVRTAGQLLEWMLLQTGDADAGKCAAAAEDLPYPVDGYLDQRMDPVDWLSQNVLPLFPVGITRGPGGLYPVVSKAYLNPSRFAGTLSAARGELYRVGLAEYDGTEIRNDIEIRYGVDCGTRAYLKSVRLTGDTRAEVGASLAFASAATTNRTAQLSWARYGEHAMTLATNIVHRRETAQVIASWMVTRYGLHSRVVEYDVPAAYTWIEPGAAVWIDDDEIALNGVCSIEAVADTNAGGLRIRVRTVVLA